MNNPFARLLSSPRSRIVLAGIATFALIAIIGAYVTVHDYYSYKDLKGLGAPARAWAFRFFVYWLFSAGTLAVATFLYQAAFEVLFRRGHRAAAALLFFTLPITLPLFHILAFLPNFGWFVARAEPGPFQTFFPLLATIAVLISINAIAKRKHLVA